MDRVTITPETLPTRLSQQDPTVNCRDLEEGRVLFFPVCPFEFPAEDLAFLRRQRQTDASFHKNISYRPLENRIRGAQSSPDEQARLLEVLGSYSRRVVGFLEQLLPPYAESWKLDYASFRPFEEKGRDLKFKARNDLLHVDAFPTRPTHGNRILRFFTNINPDQPRHWIVSEHFPELWKHFKDDPALELPRAPGLARKMGQKLTRLASRMGLPIVDRSDYDRFMLYFHDYLKSNQRFQQEHPKTHLEFPPYSCWAVFTDTVPHAALSGQFALEQTIIISRSSLILPENAPIAVLESFCGRSLARL